MVATETATGEEAPASTAAEAMENPNAEPSPLPELEAASRRRNPPDSASAIVDSAPITEVFDAVCDIASPHERPRQPVQFDEEEEYEEEDEFFWVEDEATSPALAVHESSQEEISMEDIAI
jgi:hypothetical protein